LVNLMFNWGHHTYVVPMAFPIREVAYGVSMTELLILGHIILSWRKSLDQAMRLRHHAAMRFLVASDAWIFLNLCLAIAISVPAINRYTHGTHVTVAHAMGATIGINTMILLGSMVYLAEGISGPISWGRSFHFGFGLTNSMLLIFWIALLGAGIAKSQQLAGGSAFPAVMQKLAPWFEAFALSGFGLCAGLVLMAWPLMQKCLPRNVSRHRVP
jgi:nitric oxide reductase subunit B